MFNKNINKIKIKKIISNFFIELKISSINITIIIIKTIKKIKISEILSIEKQTKKYLNLILNLKLKNNKININKIKFNQFLKE